MGIKPDPNATREERITAKLSALVDTFACLWFLFFSLWFLQLFLCPGVIDVSSLFRNCCGLCESSAKGDDHPSQKNNNDNGPPSKNGQSAVSSQKPGSQSPIGSANNVSMDLQDSQTGTVVTNTVINTQRWSRASRKQRKKIEVSIGVKLATLGVFMFGFFCDFTVFVSLFQSECYSLQNNFVVSFWLSHRFFLLVVFTHRLWHMSMSISSKQWKIQGYWLNAWQITTIVMGAMSTLHYLFALLVLVSSQTTQAVKQRWIGRVYCLQQFEPPSSVTLAAGLEFLINVIFMCLFMERIRQLKHETGLDNSRKIGQMTEVEFSNLRRLYMVGRKVAILTALTVGSTVGVVGVGYALWRPLGSLAGLDMCLNSLFLFLMFTFNSWIIEPCFGRYCDRFFCINCNCEFCVPQSHSDFADQRRRRTLSGGSSTVGGGSSNKMETPTGTELQIQTTTTTTSINEIRVQMPGSQAGHLLTAIREIDDQSVNNVLSLSKDESGAVTPRPSIDESVLSKPIPSLSALAVSSEPSRIDQETLDLPNIMESEDDFAQ